MKTKEILKYESENVNTIVLHTNKSVCRGYEVSAYWLATHLPNNKIHCKRCRSYNAHLLYVWFHTSKLDKVLEELQANGFRPVSRKNNLIILQNDAHQSNDFKSWREKTIEEIEAAALAEKEALMQELEKMTPADLEEVPKELVEVINEGDDKAEADVL